MNLQRKKVVNNYVTKYDQSNALNKIPYVMLHVSEVLYNIALFDISNLK